MSLESKQEAGSQVFAHRVRPRCMPHVLGVLIVGAARVNDIVFLDAHLGLYCALTVSCMTLQCLEPRWLNDANHRVRHTNVALLVTEQLR